MSKAVVLAMRTALAWTFVHAGVLKVWDFAHARPAAPDFAIAIQQYRLLPSPDLAVVLAVYLPWVEIFAGLALLWPRFRLGGSALIATMSLIFFTALTTAWARGLRIECGCFGRPSGPTDYPALLLRDGCLILAALFLLMRDWRRAQDKARPIFTEFDRFTLP